MKILIVTQYFWPEYFRINDLAIDLSKKNIEVDVLTGYPNYPKGEVFKDFIKDKEKFSKIENVNIYRVPIIPRKSGSKTWLILNYLSFVCMGIFYGSFLVRKKKYDNVITYATSPILVSLVSIFFCKLKKSKHIIWVLDLWPDVLNDLNIIKKDTILFKMFSQLVKYIYKKSDKILCQSITFIKEIKSLDKNLSKKLIFFPAWPEDVFDINKLEDLNIYDPSYKNILFAGNIGESQNFDLVLKVMIHLKDQKVRLYILGEGRDYERLVNYKAKCKLDNVMLLGLKPFDKIQVYFKNADFLLISLQYKKTFNSTIPGKFQTYLKYKKPILGFIGGEVNQMINKYKIGKGFDYTDEKVFLDQAKEYIIKKNEIKYSNFDKLTKIFSKVYYINKLEKICHQLIDRLKIKLITNFKDINLSTNFIISGLNLAYLGYLSKNELKFNKYTVLWPDGFFTRRFFNKQISKVAGRTFLKNINLSSDCGIKRIFVIGSVPDVSLKYLKEKFIYQQVIHVNLPYGNLKDFINLIPVFEESDLCICTLPTPKQEILSDFVATNQKHCKFICMGGAVNMTSGFEKPVPHIIENIFFAESLWRLQYEPKRRMFRLLTSIYYYFIGEITGRFNNIEFEIFNEEV
jgi:UDP-N-acetyl-D-mannosaminuronic acid transferase (WecB/TagA/CpsF family)